MTYSFDGYNYLVRLEQDGRHERRLFAYWTKADFEEALHRNDFTILGYAYVPVSKRTNWHRFFVCKEKPIR